MIKKTKFLTVIVLLTLLFTVTLTLTSCNEAGSEEIFSKEQLTENVSAEKRENRGYVWEYLDKWEFPRFDKKKLKKVEKLYYDYYYKEMPSSYELANAIAADFLKNKYDKIDLTDVGLVTDALLTSFVNSIGDDYSRYRTNRQYENYTDEMSGTKPAFYGIGVNVRTVFTADGILVISPIRHSPAYKAGILAGDVITAIDGENVLDMKFDEATDKIKGESGTKVLITVKRGEEILDITVTRGPVIVPTVDYILDEDKVGYIDINSFKANTDELFIEAVDYMKENGAKVIIYDVRDNGGGYLESVVNMLDYIAPDGITLVSFSNDYGKPEKSDDGHSMTVPSIVLCNNNSASASELFTAGMRDIGAMGYFSVSIVGRTTYGKCVMQNSYTLYDDSAITMTVAYYYPPCGVHFDGEGIVPNVDITKDLSDKEIKNLSDTDYMNLAYSEANKFISNK